MLKELPKRGDKVRYLGGDKLAWDLTVGKVYTVVGYSPTEDSVDIMDDSGDLWPIYGASYKKNNDFPRYELVARPASRLLEELEEKPGVACNLSADVISGITGVKAELANGATVTGSPADVAAVIRNLEEVEFKREIRDEGVFAVGDIVKDVEDKELLEVVYVLDGCAELYEVVGKHDNMYTLEASRLELVATAESRFDREEF